MKSYYVTSKNIPDLQDALGRMIEFAMFMAEESGVKDRIDHINMILNDDNIQMDIQEN